MSPFLYIISIYSDPLLLHSQNRTIIVLYRCYAANFAHIGGVTLFESSLHKEIIYNLSRISLIVKLRIFGIHSPYLFRPPPACGHDESGFLILLYNEEPPQTSLGLQTGRVRFRSLRSCDYVQARAACANLQSCALHPHR